MGIEIQRPVFIGGLMGSGTTMLVKTLDRHKNLACYDELQLYRVLDVMDEKLLSPDSELHTRFLSRYVSDDDILNSIRMFAESIMVKKLIEDGKPRCVEKSPLNFRYWRLYKKIFPDARIIFLIRDGRDVASSGISYNYWKTTERAADRWVASIKKSRNETEMFRADYLEIKYEDIIRETETTLRTILDFIGEDFDEAVLRLEKSSKFIGKWGENADSRSPVGRWKTDPNFDKAAFKAVAGEMLVEMGYETDLNW